MASLGHIIKITDVQAFAGKNMTNVYYYRLNQPSDLSDVAEGFQNGVIPEVVKLQSAFLTHTTLILENLNDPVEFYQVTPGGVVAGLRSGETYPSFVAWKFRYIRSTRLTRHGHKRIAGVCEGDASGNTPSPTLNAVYTDVANAMAGPITFGVLDSADPVIVGSFTGVGPIPVNEVSTVLFEGITSQVSRK